MSVIMVMAVMMVVVAAIGAVFVIMVAMLVAVVAVEEMRIVFQRPRQVERAAVEHLFKFHAGAGGAGSAGEGVGAVTCS